MLRLTEDGQALVELKLILDNGLNTFLLGLDVPVLAFILTLEAFVGN
ncbi:hypothetical protein MACH17_15080 [Phaeobacter inhibens]|nr:hypothetical protein [Phaeobacter inhibens]GLO69991.1 hypothetical protein MACH17_15080 [Phaeobacter inhibens]